MIWQLETRKVDTKCGWKYDFSKSGFATHLHIAHYELLNMLLPNIDIN